MTKKICAGVILQFMLVIFSENTFANYADTWGLSVSGIARGNAMTAVVSGWSSAYYNMAGLGKTRYEKNSFDNRDVTRKNQLALNFIVIRPNMDITTDVTEADKYLDLEMGTLGITADLEKYFYIPEVFNSVVFGMVLGMAAEEKMISMNDLDLESHNFLRYGREAKGVVASGGIGMAFMDGLFGIGLGVNMTTGGEGKMYMPDIDIVPVVSSPNTTMRVDLKGSVAPNLGVYFFPREASGLLSNFQFGMSYRGETYIDMDPFDGDMAILSQAIYMEVYMTIVEAYTPTMISFGLAYTKNNMTFSFDYELQQWSDFEFGKSRELYYQRRVPPATLPEFDDINVYKVGVSYQHSENINFLAGYMYQPTFVSDDDTANLFNLLDNDKHIYSVGLEYYVSKGIVGKYVKLPLQFNVALQYQDLRDRNVIKDRENNYKTDGLSDEDVLSYWDTVNPDYKYGGSIFLMAVEMVVRS